MGEVSGEAAPAGTLHLACNNRQVSLCRALLAGPYAAWSFPLQVFFAFRINTKQLRGLEWPLEIAAPPLLRVLHINPFDDTVSSVRMCCPLSKEGRARTCEWGRAEGAGGVCAHLRSGVDANRLFPAVILFP